jgi:hypothetical protein
VWISLEYYRSQIGQWRQRITGEKTWLSWAYWARLKVARDNWAKSKTLAIQPDDR